MGDAIEYHSRQAEEFSRGHDILSVGDHFASPFVYGRWRIRQALDVLLPRTGSGRRLVDVGCGVGDELYLFYKRGYNVLGVEPAEGMRREAVRRHPELADRLIGGTAEAIPLGCGVADYVLMVEVLRYIPHFEVVAQEVHRVLRPGGSWVFTVTPPTNWTLGPMLNWIRCKGIPLPHVQAVPQFWHRAAYLKRALGESGFRIERTVAVNYIDFIAMIVSCLWPRIGRKWVRALHPLWSFIEERRLIAWAAGYYVVKAVRNE